MSNITIPTTCPCCDYPLELVKDQLFCRNSACGAQLGKKLEHFAKVLGIKGLGPASVQKLGLADLPELYALDLDEVSIALGSHKMAEKLLQEIENSKEASLEKVLAAFSIPLIGETASKKIASVVQTIDDITHETCKQAGLGDKATANLLSWLDTELPQIREFLPFSFKSEQISKKTNRGLVCITGKLQSFKTKQEAYLALEQHGYAPTESVTKATLYLVDEGDKMSAKRKRAEELNIAIISNLSQFLNQ